jgi:DNA-binding winged helix-turn-helix (wHTH) protein
MSREQIMEAVWDANWFGPTKTLDVHVAALRRKLAGAITIEAVRGVGFRLEVVRGPVPDSKTASTSETAPTSDAASDAAFGSDTQSAPAPDQGAPGS